MQSQTAFYFDWLDCERMQRVLSSARYVVCKAFRSVQINICAEVVVFRLNTTCNTVFISWYQN